MNERKVDFAVKRTRKLDPLENAMQLLFFLCGAVAVAIVLVITEYLVVSGLPAIQKVGLGNFLLGTTWDSANKTDPQYGILPFILTSIYGTAGAILIGVPVGFLTAMFLAKAAPARLAASALMAKSRKARAASLSWVPSLVIITKGRWIS